MVNYILLRPYCNAEVMENKTNRGIDGLTALGRKTDYKSDYAPEVLETFVNRHQDND